MGPGAAGRRARRRGGAGRRAALRRDGAATGSARAGRLHPRPQGLSRAGAGGGRPGADPAARDRAPGRDRARARAAHGARRGHRIRRRGPRGRRRAPECEVDGHRHLAGRAQPGAGRTPSGSDRAAGPARAGTLPEGGRIRPLVANLPVRARRRVGRPGAGDHPLRAARGARGGHRRARGDRASLRRPRQRSSRPASIALEVGAGQAGPSPS